MARSCVCPTSGFRENSATLSLGPETQQRSDLVSFQEKQLFYFLTDKTKSQTGHCFQVFPGFWTICPSHEGKPHKRGTDESNEAETSKERRCSSGMMSFLCTRKRFCVKRLDEPELQAPSDSSRPATFSSDVSVAADDEVRAGSEESFSSSGCECPQTTRIAKTVRKHGPVGRAGPCSSRLYVQIKRVVNKRAPVAAVYPVWQTSPSFLRTDLRHLDLHKNPSTDVSVHAWGHGVLTSPQLDSQQRSAQTSSPSARRLAVMETCLRLMFGSERIERRAFVNLQ